VSDQAAVDFYNLDGTILSARVLPDEEFTELAFELHGFEDLNTAMLISIAAMRMVLHDDLGIDYVFSSHTQQRIVLRSGFVDRDLQRRLVEAVLGIRRNLGLLFRVAEREYYVEDNGGELATNSDPDLVPYQVTRGIGQAFVESFSREYRDLDERGG
jgi:hypothetical protein